MNKKTRIVAGSTVAFLLLGFTIWYKLMRREVPQPAWISQTKQNLFLYGSVGSGENAGIPYWVWLTLPRIFPEYMPGNGGYAALGASWEQGLEMPAGFAKKRVGYVRVAGNCALCHAASYRRGPDSGPEVVPFVPGRARDINSLLTFFRKCAEDPRFNADEVLAEVNSATRLQWSDYLLYKFYLVRHTQQMFLRQNAALIDSSIQRHSRDPQSQEPLSAPQMKVFTEALKEIQFPVYPFPLDEGLVHAGKKLFEENCASCHADTADKRGAVIAIEELGTDPDALELKNSRGYVAMPLSGVWMRGPYLHNRSVPTVLDLLHVKRPDTFYSGNNLLDKDKLGFEHEKSQEKGLHFVFFDTKEKGHHNTGHLYGTALSEDDKKKIVEYLKTL